VRKVRVHSNSVDAVGVAVVITPTIVSRHGGRNRPWCLADSRCGYLHHTKRAGSGGQLGASHYLARPAFIPYAGSLDLSLPNPSCDRSYACDWHQTRGNSGAICLRSQPPARPFHGPPARRRRPRQSSSAAASRSAGPMRSASVLGPVRRSRNGRGASARVSGVSPLCSASQRVPL
jgi:hypothetical protein